MKKAGSRKISLLAALGALLSCFLVASFSLHTIQIDHAHPGSNHTDAGVHAESAEEGFSSFSEYLHGTEKKLFIFTLLGFLLAGAFVCLNAVLRIGTFLRLFFKKFFTRTLSPYSYRFFDVYSELFSSGVLNTKAY